MLPYKRLIYITFILLITPILFWLSGWQWYPDAITSPQALAILYGITMTGSFPSGVITAILLMGWLIINIPKEQRQRFILVVLLIMGITQITKTLLKQTFAQPRPYISSALAHDSSQIKAFYAMPKVNQYRIIATAYSNTPEYLVKDRQKEIAYRFPSGHTIFAASWVFLFGIFAPQRKKAVTVVIMWSSAVMASRVWLGMHTPIDLMASICLAFLIVSMVLRNWQHNNTSKKRYFRIANFCCNSQIHRKFYFKRNK